MAEGRIKWYSEKKGYGFIETETEGDIFVHHKSIKEFGHFGFIKDDPVTFEIKQTPKGKQAYNVRPLKSY
jgi:CspA family cold shock protein